MTKDLKEVWAPIIDAFEELIDSLPVYETYRSALTNTADFPLLLPLVRVYEEYLNFCILASREAKKSAYGRPRPDIMLMRACLYLRRDSAPEDDFDKRME